MDISPWYPVPSSWDPPGTVVTITQGCSGSLMLISRHGDIRLTNNGFPKGRVHLISPHAQGKRVPQNAWNGPGGSNHTVILGHRAGAPRPFPLSRILRSPAAAKIIYSGNNSEICLQRNQGIEAKRMGRGNRGGGHRGGQGHKGHGVRGSDGERLDPGEPEHDPLRELRDDDEDLTDPANDEYIWPTVEEEEDD